ncbi:MAG: hypothetical protein FJ191_12920 [Gammaproteobacteria bacterium]|nr:hypothetical protein [Gammaproteobacteria bacterium]
MLIVPLAVALLFGAAGSAVPPVMDDVAVIAPEPRYVAPTLRDRVGRIWAPVAIDGRGPFRLVLDTGASHSAVTAQVAAALGLEPELDSTVLLRGATGSLAVPTIRVASLEVGDLLIEPRRLAILPDALGGAEGVLGTEGLADKRVFIDFRNDRIDIRRSRAERAAVGFVTVPVRFMRGRLLVANAVVGGITVKAIIDTGGQATIANLALRNALLRRNSRSKAGPDTVTGTTLDQQSGDRAATPPIEFGRIMVRSSAMTFVDLEIFKHWRLTREPAMLIGMDVLGLLDTLIIDYRRRELQIRLRG